jgi:probable F420-dependent oxidoreductase
MSVRIGIGMAGYPFREPQSYWRWVELCERSAIDSIWQTDRMLSEQPFLESMAAMAALAGATQRLKFGMNAIVVPFRDPLLLAKQCATIDYLSGGRLLPVFGVGRDTAPEWRTSSYGTPGQRGRRADEALVLMQRLWSEERVSFEGEFYRYRDVSIAPRPKQAPLPCWIGGASDAAVRRTARLGTGWLGGTQSPAEVRAVIEAIHKALATTQAERAASDGERRVGRSIDPDHYGASVAFHFGSWDDPDLERLVSARTGRAGSAEQARAQLAVGDARAILARLREYHDAGASKFVLLPLARGDEALLEQTRRLAEEVIPEAHAW